MRRWLFAFLACVLSHHAGASVTYPAVVPGVEIEFPRDEGSHPQYKLEWWYVTGWLDDANGGPRRGFQITFFRVRTGLGQDNPSAFAARQVLFAHAAIADPARGRLRPAQRAARAGFGLAYAKEGDVDVRLDDWSMRRMQASRYRAIARGEDFSFALDLDATQPPMLQGERGYSRKGPDPRAASYYYSLPQLVVTGEVTIDGKARKVRGRAWFDHEWSSDYVDREATGWDWLGVNLNDGGALMAFRMRNAQGGSRWASATLQSSAVPQSKPSSDDPRPNPPKRAPASAPAATRTATSSGPDQVEWLPGATWQSPRTGVRYPIRWTVRIGDRRYRVEPLLQDAELDSRSTTGILYWEGPVRLSDPVTGAELGLGYLELTGYGGKVDL